MYSGEFDVNACLEYEQSLLEKFPFIKRKVLAKTVCQRDITAYTVGNENGVLMCGAFHGMERITSQMLYKFLEDVCLRYDTNIRIKRALLKCGLTVVPMVNPDGVQISIYGEKTAGCYKSLVNQSLKRAKANHKSWQANARGVDINHNFDAGYNDVKEREIQMGIKSPAPTRYGGEFAESERETQALCTLCRNVDFKCAVALHTQGREIYYDFGENTYSKSLAIAKAMARLSGYKVAFPQGIAVGGGFKDWFIDCFGRPAFTLEIGKGENPLEPEIFDSEYKEVFKMLWYLLSISTK